MYRMTLGVTLVFTMTAVAHAQSWRVGQEREVDEGIYARLVQQEHGWRLWRFETRHSVTCKAVKSVAGQPHPIPVGAATVLFRGTPFLEITFFYDRQTWAIAGQEQEETTKFRRPGDRFWQDWHGVGEPWLTEYDGKAIELNVSSWKYPAIYVGHVEERGLLNLTGLGALFNAGLRCAAEGAATKTPVPVPMPTQLHLAFAREGDGWRITNLDAYRWPRCVAAVGRNAATIGVLDPQGAVILRRQDFRPPLDAEATDAHLNVTCTDGRVSFTATDATADLTQ